jgi:hypothetical protein
VGTFGAKGLAWARINPEGWTSPIAKFLKPGEMEAISRRMEAKEGDLVVFVADTPRIVRDALGMGIAVTFVMSLTSVVCWVIHAYLLIPSEHNVLYMIASIFDPSVDWRSFNFVDILRTLIYILVIAALVQFVEFVTQWCRSNWIQQNQPAIWNMTYKFLFLSGYLTYKITGNFQDSAGNVIGTIPFDVKKFNWAGKWDIKWRLFPIEGDKLPELVQPTQLLGQVTKQASEETGIPEGLPFIAASNDKLLQFLKYHHTVNISANVPAQMACVTAMKGPQDSVDEMRKAYQKRRDLLVEMLNDIPGIHCNTPKGAFYAFADIRDLGIPSLEFVQYLVKEAGVVLTNGSGFGCEGFVRVSYAANPKKRNEIHDSSTLLAANNMERTHAGIHVG